MKNHYETIGLSPSATHEQIKAAYTNAVLRIQGQPDFATRFAAIQEAYDILSHTEQRKSFDKELLNFYTGKFTNHSKGFSQMLQSIRKKIEQKIIPSLSIKKPAFNFKKVLPYTPYIAIVVLIIIVILCLRACNDYKPNETATTVSQDQTPQQIIPQENHEISSNEFSNGQSAIPTKADTPYYSKPAYIDPLVKDSLRLINSGYLPHHVHNGSNPDCYNYTPQSSDIENKLIVEVGGGTDVAIKILSRETNRCIRYFFINHNSTYTTYGIPQGTYYLKIAYGKQWMMNNEGGNCKGKFLRQAKYEIGKETLDYNFKYNGNGYRIPSYELRLDVIATGIMNSFRSDEISEEQFNK